MRADAKINYDRLLAVTQEAVAEHGADLSLRDVARRAEVGLGTLYRHFPTREDLLEAVLRTKFETLTTRVDTLIASTPSDEALVMWLKDVLAFSCTHRGVIGLMMSAIEDPNSALYSSCVTMRSAGTSLLVRAQAEGKARHDIDGADLFALVAALGWIYEQPNTATRANHLFQVITGALLTKG